MPKVKSFHSNFGVSMDIKGVWYKFGCAIEVEPEEGDDIAKIKKMAHDTVQLEVEKQIQDVIDAQSDTPHEPTIIDAPNE